MAEVSIEQAECLGDEICASMYPEIFEMGEENKAYVKDGKGKLEGTELENAKEAADTCPAKCIYVKN